MRRGEREVWRSTKTCCYGKRLRRKEPRKTARTREVGVLLVEHNCEVAIVAGGMA